MLEELEELALRPRLVALTEALHAHLATVSLSRGLLRQETLPCTGVCRRRARPCYQHVSSLDELGEEMAQTAVGLHGGKHVRQPSMGRLDAVRPRAHYTNSETLKHYSRTMMWLGHTDMRIDQPAAGDGSLRELAAAVVLTLALDEAGLMDESIEIDGILTPFHGSRGLPSNAAAASRDPPGRDLWTLGNLTGPEKLTALLEKIKAGQAGVQQILGHPIPAPIEDRLLVLPRSFTPFSANASHRRVEPLAKWFSTASGGRTATHQVRRWCAFLAASLGPRY